MLGEEVNWRRSLSLSEVLKWGGLGEEMSLSAGRCLSGGRCLNGGS